jgi:hypothetical protein
MNIRFFIFPIVTGVVMGFAGVNIVDQPIKTLLSILALCITHELTQEMKK